MHSTSAKLLRCALVVLAAIVLNAGRASAQSTFVVADEASLRTALNSVAPGDTIVFAGNITLSADLPTVHASVTIDGAGFSLSGNNLYRGFVVGYQPGGATAPGVVATIQNITIANTVATGGAGGAGSGGGGGGGAGLGGAIFVDATASVSVSNVNLVSNAAVGGAGGAGTTAAGSGGGGGGLGGVGGAGGALGPGGGGGFGSGAFGGAANVSGGAGIVTLYPSGGSADIGVNGGATGGGGGGGTIGGTGTSGAGGGAGGATTTGAFTGGNGGTGGGGGGGLGGVFGANTGGTGGFGGGGGGAGVGATGGFGGPGGFGGGSGGSSTGGGAGIPGLFAGAGSATTGGGGGGAGLGGAIFVQAGGTLNVNGSFTVNGSSVAGGAGTGGAASGFGVGSGLFLGGSGTLAVNPSAGQTVNIVSDIADTNGSGFGVGSWNVLINGAGTTVLSGNNSFSGNMLLLGGTLSVASGANLGIGARLDITNGTTLQLTGSGVFTKDLGVDGSGTVRVNAGQTATWAGIVGDQDVPAVLNVTGGGTLELANALNGYPDGTVVVGNSKVIAGVDSALGFGSSPVFLGDASSTGTLGINGSGFVSLRPISLGSAGGTIETIGSADALLSGPVTGSGTFTKSGTGTLTLAGANSYTGATIVNAGSLFSGGPSAFGASRSLVVGGGATVGFSGYSQNFFTLSGSGTVSFSAGESLTLGADGSSSTFLGSLVGNGSVIKSGAGTLSLFGANSFTGGISLTAGALAVQSAANLGTGALRMNDATSVFLGAGGTFGNGLAIAGRSTLNAGSGQTVTWNGLISNNVSPGTLALAGGGTFALTNGGNSYTGGTIVTGNSTVAVSSDGALGASGGTLALGDTTSSATLAMSGGSFLSSRPIVIGNLGATFDAAGGTNATLAGSISGAGGFTKTGAGTITLAGSNSYGGPTNVVGGTLRAGSGSVFTSNGALALGAGATIDLNGFSQSAGSLTGTGSLLLTNGAFLTLGGDNSSTAFGGSISGSGGLVKIGSGSLSLLGAGSYTGGIRLLGGSLLGNSDSIRGDILNNGVVAFDQGSAGTYAGSMSGSGALVKNGGGTLTLSGLNSYSGGTFINAGGLTGTTTSLQGAILDNASLTFDQGFNGLFSGLIGGTGTVTKLGAGNVTFGSGQSYTGLTTVGQGTLTLANTGLPGSVNVGTQATLAGTGTVGGNLTLGGKLSLPALTAAAGGASVSGFNRSRTAAILPFATRDLPSMVINGDLVANQGSSLDFSVSQGGTAPILVNGRASLIGSHVNVTFDDPNAARTATYTAISAANGLSLANTDATSPNSTILPVLTQAQNSLLVTLLNLRVPTTTLATTPNAIAAAGGIDVVKQCAPGDLCNVVKEVLALNGPDLDAALNSLAGEIHASNLRVLISDNRAITDLVRTNLSDFEHDSEDDPNYQKRGTQPRWWFQFTGDHSRYSSGRLSGATANVGGGGGGLDFKPSKNWSVGGGGSLSLGNMSLTDVSGDSTMNAPRAFGYTGLQFGPFHIHGGGSAAKTNNNTKRDIKFAAFVPDANGNLVPMSSGVNREAESDQDGNTEDAWSEWQHTQKWDAWTLDSKLGIRTARFSRKIFTETGAGAVSLAGAAEVFKSHETHLEVLLFKKTGAWRPRMLLTYRREFADDVTKADVNFEDRPDSQFEVNGLPVPRDTYHGLFGLTVRTLSGLEYTLEYETQQAKDESHHAFHFRMRFR
jgi:autotransporter-associated beta strand protein